jgi:hypothetical protein
MVSTTDARELQRGSMNEVAPCDVTYVSVGDQTYVQVREDDFEKILLERRSAMSLLKVWMALGLVAAVMLAGTVWWFSEHIPVKVLLTTPANLS